MSIRTGTFLLLMCLILILTFLEIKLRKKMDLKENKINKENKLTVILLILMNLVALMAKYGIINTLRINIIFFMYLIIEKIYYIYNPIKYEEKLERLENPGFENMDIYYFREKIFSIIGIGTAILFIFKGWPLIFSPGQIYFIILGRNLAMKKEGIIQSAILFLILYTSQVWEDHYIIIQYFEYIMLGLFFLFLIYSIYKSTNAKKMKEATIAILSVILLLTINIQITNSRFVKDPQLQKKIKERYDYQFRTITKSDKGQRNFVRIEDLNIDGKFSIKSLEGIEKLSNLRNLTISRQTRLIDYSNIGYLKELKRLAIKEPNSSFDINDLPKIESLEYLMVYSHTNEIDNDILKTNSFPNLKTLDIIGFYENNPITIDITGSPNIEEMFLRVESIKEIVGLKEAKNLKSISLYVDSNDYKEEIKRLRPDIEIR